MKKEYLVSADEMQRYDRNTIEKIGLKACVLMERAAYAVAMEVRSLLTDKKNPKVLVIAGNGNNGADGVCAGRILREYGIAVHICLISGRDSSYGEELQRQLDVASYYDIPVQKEFPASLQEYDLIIDALFGNGLNRQIQGAVKDVVDAVNTSGLLVVSVDIPSGIDATTGKVLGCAVKATVTVTFGFYKIGQLRYPGRKYCGKIVKAKIAINETGFFGEIPRWFTYFPKEQTHSKEAFRDPMGNKGTFGKVLVVAGRDSTTGAAILCASSALRSGCGMVAVFTEKENKEAFLKVLPEAMVETYTGFEDKTSFEKKIQKWMKWADVIVTGCGLLRDDMAYHMVKQILEETEKPVVCDADALQLIAGKEDLKAAVKKRVAGCKDGISSVVFTPHPGELASLAGCSVEDIKENRMAVADRVLEKFPVILVAKDADTLVCAKGCDTYLNVTGNDGLATAGSGDVLAGLTASMIAQYLCRKEPFLQSESVFDAVCKSVYLHGAAADFLAKENGKSFLVASDLIQAYKYILK